MKSKKSDSVFLIASHAEDYQQIDLLHNLCRKINAEGYDYIISSHLTIPDHITKGSRAALFDQKNKQIPIEGRDLTQRGRFFIKTSEFLIESPFFMHGGILVIHRLI